jgi:amino acid transporter
MGLKSNLKVFCFLHVVEALISFTLGFYHIFSFMDPNEPTTTQQPLVLICFFGFVFVSAFGVFKIARKSLNFKVDAVLSLCGFLVFIFISISSMADVEHDRHLVKFTDIQESMHPYFRNNRTQSVISLVNSLIFFMHCTFAFDFINTQPKDDLSVASETSEEEIESDKPLRLHFFFENIGKGIVNKFKNILKRE